MLKKIIYTDQSKTTIIIPLLVGAVFLSEALTRRVLSLRLDPQSHE